MKRLYAIVFLAVAFIFSAVFTAEAKVYHFEINGDPYAAYYKADGNLESFEVTAKYHAQFKEQVSQKTVARQETPKKATTKQSAEIITVPAIEVPAQTVAQEKAEKVQAQPKKNQKFMSVRLTCGENFSEGREREAISDWLAKNEEVQTPASAIEPTTEIFQQTISAPQIAGALDIGRKAEVSSQSVVLEVPKQHGQAKNTKVVPQSAVREGEVPKQHGQEVAENSSAHKLLVDWEVAEATYLVDKNGQKKLMKISVRSPRFCGEKVEPGFENCKTGHAITKRYDSHTYVDAPEILIEPGTVDYYALEPSFKYPVDKIVREVDKNKYEIRNEASGQFVEVEKPQAIKVTYFGPYEKKIEVVRVFPTEELYNFSAEHRLN